MPLKLKKSQTPSEQSSLKETLAGPWGRIKPEPESALVLRLHKRTSPSTEEIYSYPYRALSCWHWQRGIAEEELKIEAGSALVTVTGRGLARLVEALDQSALEILCEASGNSVAEIEDSIEISSINITGAED